MQEMSQPKRPAIMVDSEEVSNSRALQAAWSLVVAMGKPQTLLTVSMLKVEIVGVDILI